ATRRGRLGAWGEAWHCEGRGVRFGRVRLPDAVLRDSAITPHSFEPTVLVLYLPLPRCRARCRFFGCLREPEGRQRFPRQPQTAVRRERTDARADDAQEQHCGRGDRPLRATV